VVRQTFVYVYKINMAANGVGELWFQKYLVFEIAKLKKDEYISEIPNTIPQKV